MRARQAGATLVETVARKDYRYPCPNCWCPPRQGDRVTRVGRTWWHTDCRGAHLTTIRKGRR